MVKVGDLFHLPIFKQVRLVGGRSGLNRKVEYVTVMEVPDIKNWLKGNDFIITSFYSVRNRVDEQCRLIRELSDTCCCIAVKTGEYVCELSEQVIATADSCGLPLLELPHDLTYIDLSMRIMHLIFEENGNSAILEKYIRDILFENYTDKILMVERGRLFGFEVEYDFFAAVQISFRKNYEAKDEENKKLRFFVHTLKQSITGNHRIRECYMLKLKNGWLLLLESENNEQLNDCLHTLISEEYLKKLWGGSTEILSCGIGSVMQGMNGIRDTYSESYKAIRVGRKLKPEQTLFFYDKLTVFCELEEFFKSGRGKKLTEILEKIPSRELLETLVIYYECGANVEQAAEKMYSHKNTIKYRLNRIQDITGLNLKSPDDNFQLYLAVLAMKAGEN